MYAVHGMPFVEEFLGLHNFVRATSSEHPEQDVWYFYLLLLPISFLPWTASFSAKWLCVLKAGTFLFVPDGMVLGHSYFFIRSWLPSM